MSESNQNATVETAHESAAHGTSHAAGKGAILLLAAATAAITIGWLWLLSWGIASLLNNTAV